MNTKRQTIWLVSMLSLMVVLSAYYLFTEDVNSLDVKTTDAQMKEISLNAGQQDVTRVAAKPGDAGVSGKADAKPGAEAPKDSRSESVKENKQPAAEPKATEPNKAVEPKAEPKGENTKPEQKPDTKKPDSAKPESKSSSTKTDTPSAVKTDDKNAQPVAGSGSALSKEDANVLQKVQAKAQAGGDYFAGLQIKREEELSKQASNLIAIISDTKQTAEAAAKAQEDLRKIEDMQAKITNLEEALTKDFPQAVITQDGSKWKVTVQSAKLEKSQAVSIVDQAMKELNVQPDQISVQMVP